MTETNDHPLIPLTAALTPLRDLYAELVGSTLAWQEGRERTTDPDLVTLVCVGADSASDDDVSPTRWTRTSVYDVLRCHIPNWCSRNRCLWPPLLPEAMWDFFDFLDETGRLHPDSDPLGELRKPLLCYGGLDQRGRPLPPGAPSTIACECFVPYRETVEILHELSRRADRDGTDPIDPLRRLVGRPTGSACWPAESWEERLWDGTDDDGPPAWV